jgi:polysaccharide deacetylase family protein (PEP-CTERM system associated)
MTKPCITIDVEDWLQSTWDRSSSISAISAKNTLKLLDILDNLSIKTTMFIQGKFAKTFPSIVKQIAERDHEIASHGHSHLEVFKLSKNEFKDDVVDCKNFLEDLTSQRIVGYRAPDFSIINKNLWALEILCEAGFEYDSSIFPIKHSRYGIQNFSLNPIKLKLNNGLYITEYPLAAFHLFGKNFAVSGGGYHRLLPGFVFRYFAKKILFERPFIFYCHPYEFNPSEFLEIEHNIPFLVRLHQGLGRRFFETRFRKFIYKFGAQSIGELHSKSVWREISIGDV